MNLYEKALAFAMEAHEGQVRKYTGEPYVNHCIDVATILATHEIHADDYMIAAALLHDTVEDTPVTFKDIRKEFGQEIEFLVFFLTDVSKKEDGNREIRKEIDRWHIGFAPQQAQLIKCADLISNTQSITKYDPDFSVIYLKEKRLTLACIAENNPSICNHLVFLEARKLAWKDRKNA